MGDTVMLPNQFNGYVAELVRLISMLTENAATGEIRETCGDMNHYSMAVARTFCCAEMAWNSELAKAKAEKARAFLEKRQEEAMATLAGLT